MAEDTDNEDRHHSAPVMSQGAVPSVPHPCDNFMKRCYEPIFPDVVPKT